MTGPSPDEHRRLRELLGAYVLSGLPDDLRVVVRAHLDGCAACRAELAEIAPLAEALRGIDPSALSDRLSPPADLGQRIRAQVAREDELARARSRREQGRRTARRVAAAAAVFAVLAGAAGLGGAVGRTTAPAVVAAPAPGTPVTVRVLDGAVSTGQARIVAHTWGVEARFSGSGFAAGQVYRAAFRTSDGALLPAGEFLGTGAKELTCNMQSSLLRSDATGFVVVDRDGAEVLAADL